MPIQLGYSPTYIPSNLTGAVSHHQTPFPTAVKVRNPILNFSLAFSEIFRSAGRDISAYLADQSRPAPTGGRAPLAFNSINMATSSLRQIQRVWADGIVDVAIQGVPQSKTVVSLRHILQSFFKLEDVGIGELPNNIMELENLVYAREMTSLGRQRFETSWRLPFLYTMISTLAHGACTERNNLGVKTDILAGGQTGDYTVKGSNHAISQTGSGSAGPAAHTVANASAAFNKLRQIENSIVEGASTDDGNIQVVILMPQTDAEYFRGKAQDITKGAPEFRYPNFAREMLGLNSLSTTIWNERFRQIMAPLAAFGGYGMGSGNAVVMTCPDAVFDPVLSMKTSPTVQDLQDMRFSDNGTLEFPRGADNKVRYIAFALQDFVTGASIEFGVTPPQDGVLLSDRGQRGRQDAVLRVTHSSALLKNNVEVGRLTLTA